MPLDTIYLTRHAQRLNFTIDPKTGQYSSLYPYPTGNAADPVLTLHGVRQSQEFAAHLVSPEFAPKPFRVYSSPFYRCLQTIRPVVEALKERKESGVEDIQREADFDVRVESGLGEWFGSTSFFEHPSPSTSPELQPHFPTILPSSAVAHYKPHLIPSPRGESIAQLHNRVATTLSAIIDQVDAEVDAIESTQPSNSKRTSKAILICSHAASLIAISRALTGHMPADSGEEDFNVFTAGLSKFVRRSGPRSSLPAPSTTSSSDGTGSERGDNPDKLALAEGTRLLRSGIGSNGSSLKVPDWKGGRGVGGGWDCVLNGDCSFLSGGAERGWHFNGEESFDPIPTTTSSPSTTPVPNTESSLVGELGTKL